MKTLSLFALAFALIGSAQAIDPVIYHYSQDLSSLALPTPSLSSSARRLYLGFQLLDGTQSGNNTTRVTVSNLSLTGGTFGATLDPNIGGVTVGTNGSVTLRDSSAGSNGLADYTIAFEIPAGSALPRLDFDFDFETLPSSFDAATPDYFAVSFLLGDLSAISTDAPPPNTIGSESMGLRFDGDPLGFPGTYTATTEYAASRLAAGDARFATFARPNITVLQTPEPASLAVLGLGGLALLRRRKRS